MACVDQDVFNLTDHGHDAGTALQQLYKIDKIRCGALGEIISLIRKHVLSLAEFTWLPQAGNNAGSAAAFWRVDNQKINRISLTKVKVTVMEDKRSQLVHELVHALDVWYYYFNLSHPPLATGLARRVPVLYLFPVGDIFKYNCMDQPFVDQAFIDQHSNKLTYFQGLIRNNRLLKTWQRTMLMTQLDYAARMDKIHAEFTANVAQCLSLIYQWGFTGKEKGGLGNPRSIALVIREMESVLDRALQNWRNYQPPARSVGSVIQFTQNDQRQPPLDEKHFERNDWWKEVDGPLGF